MRQSSCTVKSEPIIVVDNFYDDPHKKREDALSCAYDAGGSYPGMLSVKRFHVDEAMKKIEAILGTEVRWDPSTANGCFRFSLASDASSHRDIHTDAMEAESPFPQWGGVCYLSLPKDCQGGTSFWRHNQTGLQKKPTPKEQAKVGGMVKIPNTPEAVGKYFKQEGLDRSRWKEVKRVQMVFNRLALFQPNLFHSHTSNFGETRENGRLTQLFFFDEVDYFIKMVMSHEIKVDHYR